MPLQYADEPKQPGETLRYSMTFTPGVAIASTDSLTGTASVTVYRLPDLLDVSNDIVGPPAITGMIVTDSVERTNNTIYVKIQAGVDGTNYKVTFKCGTTAGELAVEEELILQVREL